MCSKNYVEEQLLHTHKATHGKSHGGNQATPPKYLAPPKRHPRTSCSQSSNQLLLGPHPSSSTSVSLLITQVSTSRFVESTQSIQPIEPTPPTLCTLRIPNPPQERQLRRVPHGSRLPGPQHAGHQPSGLAGGRVARRKPWVADCNRWPKEFLVVCCFGKVFGSVKCFCLGCLSLSD